MPSKTKVKPKKLVFTQLRDDREEFIDIWTHRGREFATPKGMPDHVVIHGQHFKIRYHTYIYNKAETKERLNGCVFYGHRLIFLDPQLPLHLLKETLYHEAAHVYLRTIQNISEPLSKLNPTQVEHICDMMAAAVCDLQANN